MAQSKTPKAHEFDSIVIGGGLSGLLAANHLESTGRKVALIESHDVMGGISRPTQSVVGVIDQVLKFFPETETSEDLLIWLEGLLGMKIEREVIEAPPVNYDDGKFKPFVGFGDQKVQTAIEIDAYAKSRYYRLASSPKDWVPRLIETFTGTMLPQSVATKMIVDDEFVIEVLVNGSKRYSGREVLFCATPQQILSLLPEGQAPGRLRQRLLKGEFFTSINLDLIHNGMVTDSNAIHVLKGANEEPSVGLFHPPTQTIDGRPAQLSQWTTLVPRDITDDSELVASALKQIKRQVKRAYETSLDGLLKERIVVAPTSHGDLTGALPEDGRWPKLQNLWAISSFLDTNRNLVGALSQVRRTLASVAGDPASVISHDTDLSEQPPQPTA